MTPADKLARDAAGRIIHAFAASDQVARDQPAVAAVIRAGCASDALTVARAYLSAASVRQATLEEAAKVADGHARIRPAAHEWHLRAIAGAIAQDIRSLGVRADAMADGGGA